LDNRLNDSNLSAKIHAGGYYFFWFLHESFIRAQLSECGVYP
jgi:hypothetical protein